MERIISPTGQYAARINEAGICIKITTVEKLQTKDCNVQRVFTQHDCFANENRFSILMAESAENLKR